MFNKKLKEYKEKQSELEAKMAQYTGADEDFYLNANMLLHLVKRASQVFENSEPGTKRQVLNFLLQNTELDGKKLNFTLKTPFDKVLEANRFNSQLPSSKLIIILENRDYMAMLKDKLMEIKGVYKDLKLYPTIEMATA